MEKVIKVEDEKGQITFTFMNAEKLETALDTIREVLYTKYKKNIMETTPVEKIKA
jgi:hypothetical protein